MYSMYKNSCSISDFNDPVITRQIFLRTTGVKYKLIDIERGCVTGTDATHAEHIETIKSRMYVGLTSDQRFLPGELGMGLVEGTHRCIPDLDEREHRTFGDAGFQPYLFRLQLHGL